MSHDDVLFAGAIGSACVDHRLVCLTSRHRVHCCRGTFVSFLSLSLCSELIISPISHSLALCPKQFSGSVLSTTPSRRGYTTKVPEGENRDGGSSLALLTSLSLPAWPFIRANALLCVPILTVGAIAFFPVVIAAVLLLFGWDMIYHA